MTKSVNNNIINKAEKINKIADPKIQKKSKT